MGADRIARCAKVVDDSVHPDLTSDATLFSARKKVRTSNSICDTNGLRVFDLNDKGEEILLFFCFAGKCAKCWIPPPHSKCTSRITPIVVVYIQPTHTTHTY
jgi:hypothetical protein